MDCFYTGCLFLPESAISPLATSILKPAAFSVGLFGCFWVVGVRGL